MSGQYIYAADTFCESCGERIAEELKRADRVPADISDEWSYDSDDYPKGPYPLERTDGPDHCASADRCLEGIDLGEYGLAEDATLYGAEGRTIGALLSASLTDEGIAYLREMMSPDEIHYTRGIGSGAVHVRTPTPYQRALYRFWGEAFAEELDS